MNLSIVIPVYKDTSSLQELLPRLLAVAQKQQLSYEIILVEDSGEETEWQQLLTLQQQHPKNLVLIRLKHNVGQHYALWLGLHQAQGDILITMDADLQHPPEEIPKLLAALNPQGMELVYGTAREGHNKSRQLSSRLFNYLVHPLGKPVTRLACGFRAMRRELLQRAVSANQLFASIDTPLQAHAKHIKVVVTQHHNRHAGTSNYSTIGRLKLAATFIYRTDRFFRLLLLLSCLGIVSSALLPKHISGWVTAAGFAILITTSMLHQKEKSRLRTLKKAIDMPDYNFINEQNGKE